MSAGVLEGEEEDILLGDMRHLQWNSSLHRNVSKFISRQNYSYGIG